MTDVTVNQITGIVENTAFLTWDIVAIVITFALVLLYTYSVGKHEVISMTVSAYVASFIAIFSPHILTLSEHISIDEWMGKIVVFLVLFLLIFWIVKSNGFFEPYIVPTGYEIATFTIATYGLLLAVMATFVDPNAMATFSPWTRLIFNGDVSLTIWALVPLGAFLVLRGDT